MPAHSCGLAHRVTRAWPAPELPSVLHREGSRHLERTELRVHPADARVSKPLLPIRVFLTESVGVLVAIAARSVLGRLV